MIRNVLGLFVVFILLSQGCRELVQDEFERFDSVPVVNSVLVAGEEIRVHVSYTGSIGDTVINVVPDAGIALYCNGVFAGNMVYDGDGYYSSVTIAEAGNNYSCEIAVPGFDVITCEDSIPVPVSITGLKYNQYAGQDEEGRPYPSLTFTFANDQDTKQYFEVVIKELERGSIRDVSLIDISDPLINGEGLPIVVFSDENIIENSYEMTLNFQFTGFTYTNSQLQTDRTVLVVLRSLSYDYYQYLRKKYLYELSRYPDDMLSVVSGFNLYSNISGGYGIFAGYSFFVADTITQKLFCE